MSVKFVSINSLYLFHCRRLLPLFIDVGCHVQSNRNIDKKEKVPHLVLYFLRSPFFVLFYIPCTINVNVMDRY